MTRARGRGSRLGPLANRPDSGMVIAEIAVGMGAVVALMAMLIAAIGVGLSHVRAMDGARAGARVAARGESDAKVVAAVRDSLPGSRVVVRRDGELVAVVVMTSVSVFPALPALEVSKTAVAQGEQYE